jgi:hypothetical protein
MMVYDRLLVFYDFKPQTPTQKEPKIRKIPHGRFWSHLTMRTPNGIAHSTPHKLYTQVQVLARALMLQGLFQA